MKISASLYSNLDKEIQDIVKEMDLFHIDYIHIDCNDDINIFQDIYQIREISFTPIDLHIITDTPEKYYESIKKYRIELVTFQHENLKEPLVHPKEFSARLGISFTIETPIETFDHYEDLCSFVLFMTTTPGKSGGTFDERTFNRIREFKKRYPNKHVHVDGGVNDEVSFILRNLGVNCAVSGSYLVKSENIPKALIQLKRDNYDGSFRLRDFMIQPNELPIVKQSKTNQLEVILTTVNRSKLGFALIVDQSMKLVGVVTDGDIRRAVIDNLDDLNKLKYVNLINESPVTISEESTVKKMLEIICRHNRPILFLPVIDSYGRLSGAVSFNNLVKGEL